MTRYHWDAEDYQKNSSAQFQWAHELIEKLGLKGSETVLDLGCGDGKVTANIAQRLVTGSVMGIDNSDAMIRLARQQYPHLVFEQMDARTLVFKEQFDVVFSNAVLHWIEDHIPVITGIYESLKPGGRILLQMGAQDGIPEFMAALEQTIALPKWRNYFTEFSCPYGFKSIKDYQAWLPGVGFEIKRLELIKTHAIHQNAESFAGWIRTTWLPYNELVPECQRQEFIDAIVAQYLQSNAPEHDGRVSVLMMRLEVDAEKPESVLSSRS
ncbi:MAG: methyltransferase domain-containing protein [Methylococcaceae bacterium]|nr:methyltransferase domain-containing protein [Methylococcaceae bacterium]